MRLEGKTAFVTGADSGIGRAIAITFAREGADVAVHYHTAILENGVATGLSEPLPTGANYRVCLDPILQGPDGSTIRIADQEACEAVAHTSDGGSDESRPAFETVIIGDPEVRPSQEFIEELVRILIQILREILGQRGGFYDGIQVA